MNHEALIWYKEAHLARMDMLPPSRSKPSKSWGLINFNKFEDAQNTLVETLESSFSNAKKILFKEDSKTNE